MQRIRNYLEEITFIHSPNIQFQVCVSPDTIPEPRSR